MAVFDYGFDCDEAFLAHATTIHTTGDAATTVKNIKAIVRHNGPLYYRPLIAFADSLLPLRGGTSGPRAEASFEGWRHPSGGAGIVFGCGIRRPQWEEDYDPRHPS